MIVMKNVTKIFQFLCVCPWYNLTECAQYEKTFLFLQNKKTSASGFDQHHVADIVEKPELFASLVK